jgi:hypothetical protein
MNVLNAGIVSQFEYTSKSAGTSTELQFMEPTNEMRKGT